MLLQLAVDRPEHFAVVPRVADLVDIVEVGTPVLKRFGASAITTLRELAPGVPVLADTKTVDGGLLEAEMVHTSGATMMTVLACASAATHCTVGEFADRHGLIVVADTITTTGTTPLLPVGQTFPAGYGYVAVHFPSDQRLAGDSSTAHIDAVEDMHALGHRVSLAGGISTDNIDAAVAVAPEIVVVGSGITEADDPRGVTEWIRSRLSEPGRGWPSTPSPPS
ncbi:orotidine 5'-phosphate decarboxylase / HUMPS family protein [Pseudonocardia spinosispora]|uniref:orotidine 5'-phosphate decarboxylase / HUMPS family protein n=1 Tax=Pseudonocardia spinosispora TaxID=103441 RepID=UPI0004289ED3|nr:orotidine 5'-phosphate decarboxylase / HUMPS family protein [Pseudonocardia spinosispora]